MVAVVEMSCLVVAMAVYHGTECATPLKFAVNIIDAGRIIATYHPSIFMIKHRLGLTSIVLLNAINLHIPAAY